MYAQVLNKRNNVKLSINNTSYHLVDKFILMNNELYTFIKNKNKVRYFIKNNKEYLERTITNLTNELLQSHLDTLKIGKLEIEVLISSTLLSIKSLFIYNFAIINELQNNPNYAISLEISLRVNKHNATKWKLKTNLCLMNSSSEYIPSKIVKRTSLFNTVTSKAVSLH